MQNENSFALPIDRGPIRINFSVLWICIIFIIIILIVYLFIKYFSLRKYDFSDFPYDSGYKPVKKLGSGGFGDVYEVKKPRSNSTFAMKVIKNATITTEFEFMKQLNHPNIVQIFDSDEKSFIVMPNMKGGDLRKRLSFWKYTEKNLTKIFGYQMLSAVKYMHDRRIVHRDLKPENMLLASNDQTTLLKITDFGLAKNELRSPMVSNCGTSTYIAPEVKNSHNQIVYTNKADIYSLGVVIKECQNAENGLFNVQKFSDCNTIIKKMMKPNPVERCDINEVLEFDWAKNQDIWNKVKSLEKKFV